MSSSSDWIGVAAATEKWDAILRASQSLQSAVVVLGVSPNLRLISSDQLTLKASRPVYSALSTAKLAAAGFAMPDWRDAIGRWMAARDAPVAEGPGVTAGPGGPARPSGGSRGTRPT